MLLGELSLLGPLIRVDDDLMFRREHADRALHRARSMEEITRWYDPTLPIKRRFPRWRCTLEHSRSIGRSCRSLVAKARCNGILLRAAPWRGLMRDLRLHRR